MCIGFDKGGTFSVDNRFGRNCIIFGVDMSSTMHTDIKEKYILILGEGPPRGIDGTALTAKVFNQLYWK